MSRHQSHDEGSKPSDAQTLVIATITRVVCVRSFCSGDRGMVQCNVLASTVQDGNVGTD